VPVSLDAEDREDAQADQDEPGASGYPTPQSTPWYHRPPAVAAAGGLGVVAVAAIVLAVLQTAQHSSVPGHTVAPMTSTTTKPLPLSTTTKTTTTTTATTETATIETAETETTTTTESTTTTTTTTTMTGPRLPTTTRTPLRVNPPLANP
jgi:hypothetical protein